eukprot:g4838.t1
MTDLFSLSMLLFRQIHPIPITRAFPSRRLPSKTRRCRLRTVPNAVEKDPASSPIFAREMQEKASKNLALLLESTDPEATAAAMVEELTENFFVIASTYLEMAKKESESIVAEKLESVLRVAMKAKNKSLRIEIQLLNELLAVDSMQKRSEILRREGAKEILTMNEKYFFQLLNTMIKDVDSRADSLQNRQLMHKLDAIQEETTSILANS